VLSWNGQSQCFLRCPLSPDGFCPFRPRVSTRRYFVPLCVTTGRRVERDQKFRMFTRLPLLRVVGMAKRYGACLATSPLGRVGRSRSPESASTEAPARANDGTSERASKRTPAPSARAGRYGRRCRCHGRPERGTYSLLQAKGSRIFDRTGGEGATSEPGCPGGPARSQLRARRGMRHGRYLQGLAAERCGSLAQGCLQFFCLRRVDGAGSCPMTHAAGLEAPSRGLDDGAAWPRSASFTVSILFLLFTRGD